jgi:hypothetical protein
MGVPRISVAVCTELTSTTPFGTSSTQSQRELAFAPVRHVLERIALHFREGDGLKFHDRGEFVHGRHAAMVAERVLLSVEQRRTCECPADAAQRRSPGH